MGAQLQRSQRLSGLFMHAARRVAVLRLFRWLRDEDEDDELGTSQFGRVFLRPFSRRERNYERSARTMSHGGGARPRGQLASGGKWRRPSRAAGAKRVAQDRVPRRQFGLDSDGSSAEDVTPAPPKEDFNAVTARQRD
ncbi:hypothetical protein SKAU_G00217090 [Synaphobranchus kaupii]|uniref:Uncharacterized protein n=1 Tax=Synaphobranchus kaupii TaxID=118154 RepID=A0A9Q1FAB4_SYNKA|nr:hypothetical protein SKAU_G00217090 [Synaphobranchus kaupii]